MKICPGISKFPSLIVGRLVMSLFGLKSCIGLVSSVVRSSIIASASQRTKYFALGSNFFAFSTNAGIWFSFLLINRPKLLCHNQIYLFSLDRTHLFSGFCLSETDLSCNEQIIRCVSWIIFLNKSSTNPMFVYHQNWQFPK